MRTSAVAIGFAVLAMTGAAKAFFLALLLGGGSAFAYSPCEDGSVAGQEVANPAKSESAPATIVCNTELATVSDDSAVVTWVTNKSAPSTVSCWGIDGSDCTKSDASLVLNHYVEITGLEPGKIYFYRIENDGGPPVPLTQQSPGIFRTFDSTKLGTHLFDFASLNDMHVGESVSGQATNTPGSLPAPLGGQPIPPSFRQDDPHYWRVMNEGAIQDINARGVSFTIVKGDITSDGGADYCVAKQILDGLASPYYAVRGNHDKVEGNFRDAFFGSACPNTEDAPVIQANEVAELPDPHFDFAFEHAASSGETVRFVALDTWDNDRPLPSSSSQPPGAVGGGRLTDDQLAWLESQLSRSQKTFIFMHHPTSEISAVTAVPPVIFTVRQPDAAQFLQVVARHENVVGVLSGHTHRNWITESALAPGVPFVETASSKEYPGGYAVYKVFEKGYIQSFYKCSTADCLAWSEKTRGEYLNLYPLYTSQTGARNGSFAYRFDLRELLTTEVQ